MKKFNLRIPQNDWGTTNTKYPIASKFVSPDELTSGTINVDSDEKGSLTKRKGGINYNPTTFTGTAKDQYEVIFSDGTRHLLVVANGVAQYSTGDQVFNSIVNGSSFSAAGNFEFATYLDRVYGGNGIDSPQVYDKESPYGGVAYTVPRFKTMGAQAPSSALTAVDGGAGAIAAGTYTYKVTFLYYDFEESNGGTTSGGVTIAASRQISLSSIPVGGYGVTARKIYREISTSPGLWRLVATINDNTTTTLIDNNATSTSLIPTDNNTPPNFKYIVQNLDRLWIAGIPGDPSVVQFSAAGLPDVYPIDNFIFCNSQDFITGLALFNDKVIVFNRNSFGQILGTSADTFRYEQFPGNVGCVDNRTIQVRIIEGVPVLVWLSDKGVYAWDGSNLNHISDTIDNFLTVNIQQASVVKGSNLQSSQADFTAGTSTPSISLTLTPGMITQANPTKTWDAEAEFEESGFVGSNLATRGGNIISGVTRYEQAYSAGTHNNTLNSSGSLVMATSTNFTGESFSGSVITATGTVSGTSRLTGLAVKITPPRTGTLTQFRFFNVSFINTTQVVASVRSNVADAPSTLVGSEVVLSVTSGGPLNTITANLATPLVGGTTYWLQVRVVDTGTSSIVNVDTNTSTPSSSIVKGTGDFAGLTGYQLVKRISSGIEIKQISSDYIFTSTAISKSGQWVSDTYDTKSLSISPAAITHTGSFPVTFGATNSSITYVEGSADGISFDVIQSINNLNGTQILALTGRRYWRVRISLSTTDDRTTPTIGAFQLPFSTVATWTSAAIDHTTDIVSLDALTANSSTPGGTGITLTIATSADNLTYSSFTAIGSATPQRYSKVRALITTNGINTVTASISSITLNWTVTGSLTSQAIDTSTTSGPAGWDLFQTTFSGGVTYQMRSATTIGGLTAATYFTVTNNTFPSSVPLNKYVQWKATLTSSANNIASVDDVTVAWLVNTTGSIRAASIFYDKAYYLSVAEFGQTVNNVVLKFDSEGKWRIFRGMYINTFSFFFNDPYYGSSQVGRIVKFLPSSANTEHDGSNIEFDVRTKAFDFGDSSKRKVLVKVFVIGTGTGATYTPTFSTDGGTTFKSLVNQSGSTSFTTTNDGAPFTERLVPGSATDYNGQTILFRLYNNDSNECEIQEIQVQAWVREGDIL